MVRNLFVYVFLLVLLVLIGCSSQPNPKEISEEENLETEEVNNEEEEVQVDDSIEKEQNALKSYFDNMIKAVEDNDRETFLSYQDETNELFYSEQEVWIEGLNKKKTEGWDISVNVNNIALETLENGSIELQINMKFDETDVSNHITYPINKLNGEWKIYDLPFKKFSDGPINLYYLATMESVANIAFADVKSIVNLYTQNFGWEPEVLNVKLYDSIEEISASVAWASLYGVAVPFTSLKVLVQEAYTDVTHGHMKHEVVHMMLADLTNNNAPDFMHEGLAIFLATSVMRNSSGTLEMDFKNSEEREKFILEKIQEIPTIEMLSDINYTDNYSDIYSVGFLITKYLIQTEGLDKYLSMLTLLKENDVIDYANLEYPQISYERTVKALEQTYGPIEQISKSYIDYFNERK